MLTTVPPIDELTASVTEIESYMRLLSEGSEASLK